MNSDPPNTSNTVRQTSGTTGRSLSLLVPNQTRGTDPYAAASGSDIPVDLADEVVGMYRLMDLISESGSNGYVDKVIIAQDSLQRFINSVSPGAYASITKVDFKILDRLSIKPLGIYGCKDEIVRLLQSIGAVDKKFLVFLDSPLRARLLLAPSDVGGSRRTLSSGLYIVTASAVGPADERHYVIYWPEDSTWDDSASSSVRRNRVTFMRYLTKMCDQVVALISTGHSASIIWNDEDRDSVSIDMDVGDSERLFTFEVAKTNEQEESAVSRPGFQINSRAIVPNQAPLDCQVDPSLFVPRLIPGETVQGLLTATYIPPRVRFEAFDQRPFSRVALSELLKTNALVLSEDLDEDSVQTLVDVALGSHYPEQYNEWLARSQFNRDVFLREKTKRKSAIARDVINNEDSLQRALREEVVDHVINLFPTLDRDGLFTNAQVHDPNLGSENLVRLSDIRAQYPTFESIYEKRINDTRFDGVPSKGRDFKALKLGVLCLWRLQNENKHMRPDTRSALIQALVVENNFQKAFQLFQRRYSTFARTFASFWFGSSEGEAFKNQMKHYAAQVSDSQFMQLLQRADDEALRSTVQQAKALAQTELSSSINTVLKTMTRDVLTMQQDLYGREVQLQLENEERETLKGALVEFIREINKKSAERKNPTIYLDHIEVGKEKRGAPDYSVTGRSEMPPQVPRTELCVHPMDLTSEDKHSMQLDPKYVPTPTINDRLSSSFCLSTSARIAFYQLLENEKLLLVLANRDRFLVYLERLPVLDIAIQRGRPIKSLNRDKLGRGVLFAFDETKRTLAVCASTKLQLHVFVFDEAFRTLQGQGSAIDLVPWYRQAEISILNMTSVCGSEEVALVDSSACVRIFSFITLQFRPAFVQLQTPPNAGIALDVPDFSLEGAVLTSMVDRGQVFFLGLDINGQAVKSVAIDITKKVTEFLFKEKGKLIPNSRPTQHNSLLDCHADVWTRFPVLPAVKRRTITSLSERQQKTLTFIAENHTRPFASYFSDLVQTFEKTTRKPTGDELSGIKVTAAQFRPFWEEVLSASDWKVSRYRVGEWLVDLLCLIPIHIAVCRDNRFVPLADGVLSAELERSLLGAEVNQIVDKLSFGWYESIFQSYLALKPVKVVSSMGQQSIGKSFALNHLVDTSFAGSAMRTTGVDSIERSPQEDTLLVLFNTAISNLVLFRNNFAFSRDISGLFQSFQSSASVLDPVANPTLFQSTLVIIIKDVVEADTAEITREFSLKFQRIVQQEQDANFISRLHGGRLNIIPWPVIESRNFYKLFATLKKRLDLQKVSHPTAGEFLYTIKTLMAKLKANDWGALSHTMAENRAKSLSALLLVAFATGYSEVDSDPEPLKNFDSDLAVECDDTEARFAIYDREQPPSDEVEMYLVALLKSWKPGNPRQFMPDSEWVGELASHLGWLVDLRVNHVRRWLDSNLEKFEGGHGAIEDIRRKLNARLAISSAFEVGYMMATTAVKPTITLDIQGGMCVSSALTCVASLAVYKIAPRLWDMPETTICVPHLYICAVKYVPTYFAGNVELPGGKMLSCQGSCSIPSDQEHDSHSCDLRLCLATCELCKRLCGQPHLHGLIRGAHHLCGSPCDAPGICQIDMSPQSIEDIFTGRHETFQYTKYAQGHTQQEHETSHGSMTETRLAVDGPDGASLELGGRKFSANDEGAPMMCNLVCSSMGRHVHIDYCRANPDGPCDGVGVQHINDRVLPNPDKPKDAITHSLYWRRMDPYTRDEQVNFGKCDAMCSGPEHSAAEMAQAQPQPSYCTLPMFHPPKSTNDPTDGPGYISSDGHVFSCKNPAVVQQAFHVGKIRDDKRGNGGKNNANRGKNPVQHSPLPDPEHEAKGLEPGLGTLVWIKVQCDSLLWLSSKLWVWQ
ncbi:hypothetical protein H4582DRAFT_2058133 [Lactarius indigo]|nr:hypothetical protein H4582DRAFT_2058133 [Lactarius indigo]